MLAIIKKLFPYLRFLKPVRFQLMLAILCGLIYGATMGVGLPVLIKYAAPKMLSVDRPEISIWMLLMYTSCPLWIMFFRSSASFINSYYLGLCGQELLKQVRFMLYDKIQALPLAFFNKYTPADVITRTMGDSAVLQSALVEFSQDAIKQPITLIGAIGTICYLCFTQSDVVFLLIFIVAVPTTIIPIRKMGLKLQKKAHQSQAGSANLTHRLTQNLAAIAEVRSFCLEDYEKSRYKVAYEVLVAQMMKMLKYNILLTPIIEVISTIGVCCAFFYAYLAHIPAEVFMATAVALYMTYEPIKKIGRLSNSLTVAQASLERIEQVINEPVGIDDPENPISPLPVIAGNIRFEGVSFQYDKAPVLKNISETLVAGKTYALVGSSGAGKTTFANLLPRFYDVNHGAIMIDGMDIRDMRLKDLRSNISIVTQAPTLFNDTVLNNILVGDLNASREEVYEAAKKAYAHDFIMTLPQGYDTGCGEDGTMLSGGQKQRIAVARAFLKNAPILIMDEATSALDAISEHYIQKALERLIVNKTVIIIAHRFSSIKHANEILVFKDGEVVERGKHDELFADVNGVYHKLYLQQMPKSKEKEKGGEGLFSVAV